MNEELVMGAAAYESAGMEMFNMQKVHLDPDDVLVLNVDEFISEADAQRFRNKLRDKFPKHEVLVLGKGMYLSVVKGS